MKLAEVAFNVPVDKNFFYLIPEGLPLTPLLRVKADFAGRKLIGFALRIVDEDEVKSEVQGIKLKTIEAVLDSEPILNEKTLALAEWLHRTYLSPLGEVLAAMTPSGVRPKKVEFPYQYRGILSHLNEEQRIAFREIAPAIGKGGGFLIHGVTGSGKTEVYKHLAKHAIEKGYSVIILIPEISLTPQTLERFYEAFGESIAVYHSRLSKGERNGEWQRCLRGEARVVIGPRSAIFAPMKNLGLIIIDEEHETSYKSGQSPRYHARQVAFQRMKSDGAALVLGSATPQVESYYHAKSGTLKRIELKERFGNKGLPETEIIDMKSEESGNVFLSTVLFEKITGVLAQKKQTLLFLNRRGFSPSLICKSCGHTFMCPNCAVNLSFHKYERLMQCHYCGHEEPVPHSCPECGSLEIEEIGVGTERLEEILRSTFPSAAIERMDLDTMKKKHSYSEILSRVKKGDVDILIGTQMVAKGHDIAGLQLVGALYPDIMLSIPDFRSGERTFTLLTQAIGRAGRREEKGMAVIQTFLPEHSAITTAAVQDYIAFYESEIEKRKAFHYPPFSRLGRIVIRGREQEKVSAMAEILRSKLRDLSRKYRQIQILGPVTCPLEKLNNQFRYHIIMKAKFAPDILSLMEEIRDAFQSEKLSKFLHLELDIDPVNLT